MVHIPRNPYIDDPKISFYKQMLKFLVKILSLPPDDPVRFCYEVLRKSHEIKPSKYNWATSIRQLLETLGGARLWEKQDHILLLRKIPSLLHEAKLNFNVSKIYHMRISKRFKPYYIAKKLMLIGKIILIFMDQGKKILYLQLRLSFCHFTFRGKVHRLHQLEAFYDNTKPDTCQTCNMKVKEDV